MRVDAGRVSLERGAHDGRSSPPFSFGGTAQVEGEKTAIDRECVLAENLGQSSVGGAAIEVHLP